MSALQGRSGLPKARRLIGLRRLSQIIFVSLCLFITWAVSLPIKSPSLSHLYFKADPLLVLSNSLALHLFVPGIFLSLCILILTASLGRAFCGWLCPMGSLLDFVSFIRTKFDKRLRRHRPQRLPKYLFLIIIFTSALLGLQIAYLLSPIALFVRSHALVIFPTVTNGFDSSLLSLVRSGHFPQAGEDVYRFLNYHLLEGNRQIFFGTLGIFSIFLVALATVFYKRRFWCISICPMGALLALVSKRAPFQRRVSVGCDGCGICASGCRMDAIMKGGASYKNEECLLCMDCIYDCPQHTTSFGFKNRASGGACTSNGACQTHSAMTRREFIKASSAAVAFGFFGAKTVKLFAKDTEDSLIRPPGASSEEEFINRCVRCSNCMRACPTNGLQPAIFESGVSGLWTPHLAPHIGYCEYNCNLCGQVCPAGAIPNLPLAQKVRLKLGIARIDRSICLPWAKERDCIVCEEVCPLPKKAIVVKEDMPLGARDVLMRPYVIEHLCIGCAICEHKCPTRPRAIRVNARGRDVIYF